MTAQFVWKACQKKLLYKKNMTSWFGFIKLDLNKLQE